MKVISFNINSIRARKHQLEKVIELHRPDVICLQETKVADEDFPHADFSDLGYHFEIHGQKGHYGVATLSLQKPLEVQKGFSTDDEDAQKRTLITLHGSSDKTVRIFNGYFPQGESRDHATKFPAKAKYYADLIEFLNNTQDEHYIVLGDFNISHQDIDIGIGEPNRKRWLKTGKCSFLPEEREWLNKVMDFGLVDTFRHCYPEVNDRFSWFDYRSKGFEDEPKRGLRIDLILASKALAQSVKSAGIDYEVRGMEKPSDHCPIWSEFEL